jgi:hypothetical protein
MVLAESQLSLISAGRHAAHESHVSIRVSDDDVGHEGNGSWL